MAEFGDGAGGYRESMQARRLRRRPVRPTGGGRATFYVETLGLRAQRDRRGRLGRVETSPASYQPTDLRLRRPDRRPPRTSPLPVEDVEAARRIRSDVEDEGALEAGSSSGESSTRGLPHGASGPGRQRSLHHRYAPSRTSCLEPASADFVRSGPDMERRSASTETLGPAEPRASWPSRDRQRLALPRRPDRHRQEFSPHGGAIALARSGRRGERARARGDGRRVPRRDPRHRRLPHGVLHGQRGQRADAPPALRAAMMASSASTSCPFLRRTSRGRRLLRATCSGSRSNPRTRRQRLEQFEPGR